MRRNDGPSAPDPFVRLVAEGMASKGVGLRELCRGVGLDASFFSKVLSGKRSPPGQEAVLRQIAAFLGLDEVGLIVAAGRIPSEWRSLMDDAGIFQSAHSLITGSRAGSGIRPARPKPPACAPRSAQPPRTMDTRRGGLSEELL